MDIQKDIEQHHKHKQVRHDDQKYRAALERIAELERTVEAYTALAEDTTACTITPDTTPSHGEATAIAIASDWHVEEVVDPKTVQGRNKYNPKIAKDRAQRFFQKIVRMTDKERKDVTINNLILHLGGDFISGNIHDELLESCAMRPVEAVLYAQELLSGGLGFLEEHGKFKRIVVVCSHGNHARITPKKHIATTSGNSLELGLYHALARKHTACRWLIERGYHTYLSVYGKRFRFHHGDAIRYNGGVGGMTIPLMRAIYQWNQQEPADLDLLGHMHSYTPARRFIVNGSLIGFNAFAVHIKAEYQPPIQAFFLWDKVRGPTIHAPLLL